MDTPSAGRPCEPRACGIIGPGHTCKTVNQNDLMDFFCVKNVWKCNCISGSKGDSPMKAVHRTIICTVFFLAMLGAAFAQHIQTDFDHQANFSQYKTYSWQQIKAADSLWDSRIKNAV